MIWRRKHKCPVSDEDKTYLEDCFLWLGNEFGDEIIKNKEVILPTKDFFKRQFGGSKEDAYYVFKELCQHMEVDESNIELIFYSEKRPTELGDGVLLIPEEGEQSTLGNYSQYDDGSIEIMIEESQLNNPISLIATLAHELAHVKLLGENRMQENDEIITELTVLIFGLGIFNANTSVVKMSTWSGSLYTGWQLTGGSGYLNYKLHGFALALYANYRKELTPDWANYLEKDVLKEFDRGMKYIKHNPDQIKFK
jgi:hypothetical protein